MFRAFVVGALLISSVSAKDCGDDDIKVPIRWCVVDGSPAVLTPQNAPRNYFNNEPETSVDDVLWRRGERATDFIYYDTTGIIFRSAYFDTRIRQDEKLNFPVIPDPCPPLDVKLCQGGAMNGLSCDPDNASSFCGAEIECKENKSCPCATGCGVKLGDLDFKDSTDPKLSLFSQEMEEAFTSCEKKWQDLSKAAEVPVGGIIVVNARQFVNADTGAVSKNAVAGIGGLKWSGVENARCSDPITAKYAKFPRVVLWDNQIFNPAWYAGKEPLLAHELGHALGLGHGNGKDDNEIEGFDACDPKEDDCAKPWVLMTSSGCVGITNEPERPTTITDPEQKGVLRHFACESISESQSSTQDRKEERNVQEGVKPSPFVGDLYTDTIREVSDPFIDMRQVGLFVDRETEDTIIFHELIGNYDPTGPPDGVGPIPSFQYVLFADLDDNPNTGGEPSTLSFMTDFKGAELITRVVLSGSYGIIERGGPIWSFRVTAWSFQNGTFVESADSKEPTGEPLTRLRSHFDPAEDESESSDSEQGYEIRVQIPESFRGPMGNRVRIQAVTEKIGDPSARDVLPDEGFGYMFIPEVLPSFPQCFPSTASVDPGETLRIEVTGLLANEPLKVFLGDRKIATGETDETGGAILDTHIPIDARPGKRLITIGNVGSALTADCGVTVNVGPPVALSPEVAVNKPVSGSEHTVFASVRNSEGDAIEGAEVQFRVTQGPNAGITGTCEDQSCLTDRDGRVKFTYTSKTGAKGVDTIVATSPTTGQSSNVAIKFWDEDCNENGKPDACELSCSGFNGECSSITGCGDSMDVDGNGIPDECKDPTPTYVTLTAMDTDGEGCIEVNGAGNVAVDDKLILSACDAKEEKQKFSYDGIQFHTALDENLCWQAGRERIRDGKKIRLYPCESSEPRQMFDWDAVAGGRITLKQDTVSELCIIYKGETADIGADDVIVKDCDKIGQRKGWKVL